MADPVRPRILLNCAMSQDGHIAGPDGQPVRLSDDTDLRRVHAMRAAVDAIVVGSGTILADDPSLRVKARYAAGRDPLRVVLDGRFRTPPGARAVDGSAPTIVYTAQPVRPCGEADVVRVPGGADGVDLEAVLSDLASRGVESVMVEGGARVLQSFLAHRLWDEWTVYEAPVHLGGGPALPRPAVLREWGVEEAGAVVQGEGWLKTFGRS